MHDNVMNSIHEFEKAWTEKYPGKLPGYCHNIYHMVTEDIDGNITGEAFGVNCMTDHGMNALFTNFTGQNVYNFQLYIGNGTSIPDPSSQVMESLITSSPATKTSSQYGMSTIIDNRYYSDIDMNVITGKIYEGYFNYTSLNSIGDAVTITEIGLANTSATTLDFHARIYDSTGTPSSIIKRKNERLIITVYIRHLRPMGDIIDKLWNKNVFMLSRVGVLPTYGTDWDCFYTSIKYQACHTVFLYNAYSKTYYELTKSFQNGILTVTPPDTYAGSVFIDNEKAYIQQIFNSYELEGDPYRDNNNAYRNARWVFFPKQTTPEFIESTLLSTNSNTTNHISYVFGYDSKNVSISDQYRWYKYHHGQIPVVDIDVSGNNAGIWMYNCQTNEWDISETHNNPTTTEFGGVYDYLIHKITDYGYINITDSIGNYQVWINPFTNIPITKISNTSGGQGFRLYATDTYWDTSSWEVIPDLSQISQSLGTKRFYCVIGDSNIGTGDSYFRYGDPRSTLVVTRDYETLTITTMEPKSRINYGTGDYSGYPSYMYYKGKFVSDDTYGYIAGDSYLVYPDTDDQNPTLYNNPYTQLFAESDTDNISTGTYWYKYYLTGVSDDFCHKCLIWNTSDGDKVVVMGNTSWANGYRVYTIDMDPTVTPTYENCSFTTAWNSNNMPHFSSSMDGFFATSYVNGSVNVNKTYILNVYGGINHDECEMTVLDGYHHCHIIELTKYIAGVKADVVDHVQIDIIDMETLTVYRSIHLNSAYTFSGMAGFDNFLYIRYLQSSVGSIMLYSIEEDASEMLNADNAQIAINNTSYLYHIQRAVPSNGNMPSCMVIGGSDIYPINSSMYHMLFTADRPTQPVYLVNKDNIIENTNYKDQTQQVCAGIRNQSCQLKYCNNNKQLLFAFSSYRQMVIDVGYVVNNGQHDIWPYYKYDYNSTGTGSICLYKNRVGYISLMESTGSTGFNNYIGFNPIELYVNHKIGLYTRTIQAYNNPIQIGGVSGIKYQYTNRAQIPLNNT